MFPFTVFRPAARLFAAGIALHLFLIARPALAEDRHADIAIAVVPGQMKYSVESFTVEPRERVKLTLTDGDSMQHNLVICKPGPDTGMKVAQAAWVLGAAALQREYIPDSPDILFHTHLLNPGTADTITFQAPAQVGDYPYVCTMPGHAMMMKGVMHVVHSEPIPARVSLEDVTWRLYPGARSLADIGNGPQPAGHRAHGSVFDMNAIPAPAPPYGVAWEGMLVTTGTDPFTFQFDSRRANLSIDGKPIANGEIPLQPGRHAIALRYWCNEDDPRLTAIVHCVAANQSTALTATRRKQTVLKPSAGPLVQRGLFPDVPSGALAVGFPDRFNYCFDVEQCTVRYYWIGRFLDVAPNLEGRGGRESIPLGPRIDLGAKTCPLRIGANDQPSVQFLGYRVGAAPQILFAVDGQQVTETVSEATGADGKVGLRETFDLPSVRMPVRFVTPLPKTRIVSGDGTLSDGGLSMDAKRAAHFSVLIFPPS